MTHTDKQPQTVYVEVSDTEYFSEETKSKMLLSKCDSVYIHTPEELEALKAKWKREAVDKTWEACWNYWQEIGKIYGDKNKYPDKAEYLDQHYPLPNQ